MKINSSSPVDKDDPSHTPQEIHTKKDTPIPPLPSQQLKGLAASAYDRAVRIINPDRVPALFSMQTYSYREAIIRSIEEGLDRMGLTENQIHFMKFKERFFIFAIELSELICDMHVIREKSFKNIWNHASEVRKYPLSAYVFYRGVVDVSLTDDQLEHYPNAITLGVAQVVSRVLKASGYDKDMDYRKHQSLQTARQEEDRYYEGKARLRGLTHFSSKTQPHSAAITLRRRPSAPDQLENMAPDAFERAETMVGQLYHMKKIKDVVFPLEEYGELTRTVIGLTNEALHHMHLTQHQIDYMKCTDRHFMFVIALSNIIVDFHALKETTLTYLAKKEAFCQRVKEEVSDVFKSAGYDKSVTYSNYSTAREAQAEKEKRSIPGEEVSTTSKQEAILQTGRSLLKRIIASKERETGHGHSC